MLPFLLLTTLAASSKLADQIISLNLKSVILVFNNSNDLYENWNCTAQMLQLQNTFLLDTKPLAQDLKDILDAGVDVTYTTTLNIWLDQVDKFVLDAAKTFDSHAVFLQDSTEFMAVRATADTKRILSQLNQDGDLVPTLQQELQKNSIKILIYGNGDRHFPSGDFFFAGESSFATDPPHKKLIQGKPWPLMIKAHPAITREKLVRYQIYKAGSCGTEAQGERNIGKYSLTIKILTFNRVESLKRLLNSLSSANYSRIPDGKRLDVEIFVDFPQEPNLESLNTRRDTLSAAKSWNWEHGDKRIHARLENVGLAGQWHELWYPTSSNDLAFVLEDDLQVSPMVFI